MGIVFMTIMKFLNFISIFVLFEVGMSSKIVQVRGNQVQRPRLPDTFKHVQPLPVEKNPNFSEAFGPTGGRNESSDQGTVKRNNRGGTKFNPRKFSPPKVHKAVCPEDNNDK